MARQIDDAAASERKENRHLKFGKESKQTKLTAASQMRCWNLTSKMDPHLSLAEPTTWRFDSQLGFSIKLQTKQNLFRDDLFLRNVSYHTTTSADLWEKFRAQINQKMRSIIERNPKQMILKKAFPGGSGNEKLIIRESEQNPYLISDNDALATITPRGLWRCRHKTTPA